MGKKISKRHPQELEIEELRARLNEAEKALRANRSGEVDAVAASGSPSDQVSPNLTEQKRTEEALRKNEERLSLAITAAQMGIWELDLATDSAVRSARYDEIFGYSTPRLDWGFETFMAHVVQEDRGSVRERFEEAYATGHLHLECRIRRANDHSLRWIAAQGRIIRNEKNEPAQILSTVADITNRKWAETELRRVNRALRTIGECKQVLVRATDESALLNDICGTLVGVGGYRMAWVGIAEHDEAKSVRPVAHAGFEQEYLQKTAISWADAGGAGPTGKAIRTREYVTARNLPAESNPDPWVEEQLKRGYASTIALPILLDDKVLGAVTIYAKEPDAFDREELRLLNELSDELAYSVKALRAQAEHKEMERKLLQVQKIEAVGRLAGGVAHDFNNLLTIINGYTQLLIEETPVDDSRFDYIHEILRAGERAAALTRQLLAFSRRQVLEPRLLNLNSVLTDLEKMLRRLIGEDVDLVMTLKPHLSLVKVDPGQIEQVVMNLAINARDAMPGGGRLLIETAVIYIDNDNAQGNVNFTPVKYIMLAVSDTGCGMDLETQAHIFEPFFTTKEKGKGTGLGLATVYGIVKQSGGFIWVQSEPGGGSRFKIYFPCVEEVAPLEQRDKVQVQHERGSETVMVVEDEEPVRTLVCQTLISHGYNVLEASGVEGALDIAAQYLEPIHLLLTDVVMPNAGGKELATGLAALHPETKVLYMSGYPDDAIVRHGILLGDIAFLQKPFANNALLLKVREVLESKRTTQQES